MGSQEVWNPGRAWSGVLDDIRSITNAENITGNFPGSPVVETLPSNVGVQI